MYHSVVLFCTLTAAQPPTDPTKRELPTLDLKHWRLVLKPEGNVDTRPPNAPRRPGEPPPRRKPGEPLPNPPVQYFLIEYHGRVVARAGSADEIVVFAKKHFPEFPVSPYPGEQGPADRPYQVLANVIAISWVMPSTAVPDGGTLERLSRGDDKFARNVYTTHREMLEKAEEYRKLFEKKQAGTSERGK